MGRVCGRYGERRGAYGGWLKNFKKRELGRPMHSRMDNSKMDLQEYDMEGM